jgi:hypothetical protein
MSQQRQRRPARSRSTHPAPPSAESTTIDQPTGPIVVGDPAPELAAAADEHGWIAIGMMLFGLAIVGFVVILVAAAAG